MCHIRNILSTGLFFRLACPANVTHEPRGVSRVVFDALVRSDFFLDLFSGDFTIPENLGDKSATDGLAAMDRNHGASAVGVTEEMMASLGPNEIKTKATKRLDELGAVKCGKGAHAMTATR